MAEALPGAAAVLCQNLSIVPNAVPPAAPATVEGASTQGLRPAGRPPGNWGRSTVYQSGQIEGAAPEAVTADTAAGIDSDAGSGGSTSAAAGASDTDTEPEPFLDLNFCARQPQLHACRSETDSSPPATPRQLPFPLKPGLQPGDSGSVGTQAKAPGDAAWRSRKRADASGASSNGGAGDDTRGHDNSGEDVAVLKAERHGQPSGQPAAPSAGQLSHLADGAAYLRWQATSSYNVSGSRLDPIT